jgi:hypothetical protein
VGDVVCSAATHEGQLARRQFECRRRVVEPQPRPSLHDGVHRQLDGAKNLRSRGLAARTAARHGADVLFDWDDPATQRAALTRADRVYLVAPAPRVRYAGPVSAFLDLAEGAGVLHVTYLSTYRGDHSPSTMDFRAVELDLVRRDAFTHTILRPGWVMQNFADHHMPIIDGVLTVPAGAGAEAFVDPRTSPRWPPRRSRTPRTTRGRGTHRPGPRRSPSTGSRRSSAR